MIGAALANMARVLCGCRARWLDAPAVDGPCVYYANHTSHFDALVIWSAFPSAMRKRCRIVAAADYWQATRMRRWLAYDVFNAIVIDRKNPSRHNNPVAKICAALDDGDSVVIFPEGTRSDDGGVHEFRAGLWHIARRREAQAFVPIWLENLSRVLPKGEFLPVPILCAMTIGRSIRRQAGQPRGEFLEAIRAQLEQLREVHA